MKDFPPYSTEEIVAIKALGTEDISEIDKALLANSLSDWQKTAMVVIKAMYAYPEKYQEIPDHFYGRRLQILVDSGQLELRGNITDIRSSEIRLKTSVAAA